ncbi:RNA-binding protein [Aureimonas flava]|uniref:RNA-binding protein n=1 Tax=Aureimonas flava TaxID=2320271 RepID=A0A3A1WIJ7_9HYPH|nr:RNA-binding protein [Aureimonas flava]RIY00793.1 RNA-binding protein [Aureimonas flava]
MNGDEDGDLEEAVMNGRMCIVSRRSLPAGALIRFVADPDGRVVPDLKRRLPGRGAHVEARRSAVEAALKRRLLARALKRELAGTETLADDLEALLVRAAAGALALARKAGQVTTGAAKVDAALRAGKALASLHAADGAADGVRKLDGARHARAFETGAEPVPAFHTLTAAEIGLAMGDHNVIHAAILPGGAGAALIERLEALETYRGASARATTIADTGDPGP